MEIITRLLHFDWMSLAAPAAVLVATVAIGYIAKRLLFRSLRHWAEKTRTRSDDLLVHALSGAFMIWMVILGLRLALQTADFSERVTAMTSKALLILWVISLMMVAVRLGGGFVRVFSREMHGAPPVTSLTQNLLRLLVLGTGSLIILDLLGMSITPILTALGVGGLAVALALQDTLSNLFAGFYISIAGHLRPGDYVKLDSGEEGHIADITWRSTTIHTLANNLVITPNARLAQAIVTNFHLPAKNVATRVQVSVSYHSDIDRVEQLLLEEGIKGATEIPGMLAEPAPVVRLNPGFGESSLDFTLAFHVAEFDQQFLVQHELRKRIFKRFRAEGVEIPFPARSVYLRNDAGPVAKRAEP